MASGERDDVKVHRRYLFRKCIMVGGVILTTGGG
jgi:hypothetical protein